MTERRIIKRNEQGQISGIVGEDGQLTVVERDEHGRPVALIDDRVPAEPPATAADVGRLERTIAGMRRGSAEALERQTEHLRREIAATVPPPAPPANWMEYGKLVKAMSQKLGNRRDGSGLHAAIVGAVAAAEAGDVVRACELLRAAEGEA